MRSQHDSRFFSFFFWIFTFSLFFFFGKTFQKKKRAAIWGNLHAKKYPEYLKREREREREKKKRKKRIRYAFLREEERREKREREREKRRETALEGQNQSIVGAEELALRRSRL